MRGLARQAAPSTPPCAAGSYGQHRNPSNADDPSRSKRPGDRGQCRGTTTAHRSSPWAPHQPKLARNSGTRTLCSAPKRCNSNDAISMFEIHVGELRAIFLRNHNMRHHKDTTKCPKQKTAQAQKTPTSPATTTTRSTGALHPLRGGAPVTWRCTRTEEVHCLRIGCSAPTHKNKRGTGTPNHSPPQPARARRAGNDDPVSVDSGPSPRPRTPRCPRVCPQRRYARPRCLRPAPCR